VTLAGQITAELPGGALALSTAKTVEEGARAALLLAPGLFRLDVHPLEDTLHLLVRALGNTPVQWRVEGQVAQRVAPAAVALQPGAHAISLQAGDRHAEITIALTRDPDEGLTHFVAQARIRRRPTAPGPMVGASDARRA
jgi:hypothetical protein